MQSFFDRIELIPFHSCWEWIGSKFTSGYGRIETKGKTKKAHRLSYEIHHGPIGKDLLVCHCCDNPACVNPDHLFLGTHLDNTRDMLKKGRAKFTGRPRKNADKSMDNEVKALYKGKGNGPTIKELAMKFGLSETTVRRIVKV